MVVDGQKRCSRCKDPKDANTEHFYADKSKLDRLSSQCRECAKDKSKQWKKENYARALGHNKKWNARNQEKIKQASRAWSRNNKERMAELQREWRKNNRERAKETDRIYREKNSEKVKENQRKTREKHGDKYRATEREFRRQHPEISRQQCAVRRARINGASVCDLTRSQWELIKAHFGYCCAYCGIRPQRLEMDHVIPLSRGGNHTVSNVVPACGSCNRKKHAGPPLVPVQPLLSVV